MNKFLVLFESRGLFTSLGCRFVSTKLTVDGKIIPKKKTFENRITLIGVDNSVSITDFKNAESLSQRRELKLVKVQDVDSKTRRPIYKLMTNAEYHTEELQRRKEKQEIRQKNIVKSVKLLSLSSKIGDHDLMTGVRKMIKLLEKQHEVKVVIIGEGEQASINSERLYSVIESNVKSVGKIVQKRNKGNSLRFQLLPAKQSSIESTNDVNNSQNENNKGPL
ncbi:uncharacterized protein LOC113523376 [Galleria mellonella]|uniref:Uncharacterized protein LOC113523376 n=1 Tax=Galleria mellonella TaxID=7137 RepID=A0A6J1X5G1_GALME|nr:uncharacterized protein LOC113523376 [Galleria mellonella]